MAKQKYTKWFPASINPVHFGWYPIKEDDEFSPFSDEACPRKYWDGEWSEVSVSGDTDALCKSCKNTRSSDQTDFKWRGLTAPHPEYKP